MLRIHARRAACALLLLLLLTPALAGAAGPSRERVSLDRWLPGLWSFLTGLWAETGSSLDPNGKPDTGGSLDPDGLARTDEGPSLDPNGRD